MTRRARVRGSPCIVRTAVGVTTWYKCIALQTIAQLTHKTKSAPLSSRNISLGQKVRSSARQANPLKMVNYWLSMKPTYSFLKLLFSSAYNFATHNFKTKHASWYCKCAWHAARRCFFKLPWPTKCTLHLTELRVVVLRLVVMHNFC